MRSTGRTRHRKALALTLVLLVLAVGFCIFDRDEHQDGHVGLDLCLGMLATLGHFALVISLPLAGLAAATRPAPPLQFCLRVPAPPPKVELS